MEPSNFPSGNADGTGNPDAASRDFVKLVTVGHVDHGKSTLVGRLLYDTGSLADGKLEELKAVAERRGMPLEWSFVLDAFQAERDQAVTIDTTQIRFATARRDYAIIDAPGHAEFLKNMVSGAAEADAGILVVDAKEGMQEQTRRHGYLLHLLGVRQVAVVINKMDLVGYDSARFGEVAARTTDYLVGLGIRPTAILPVAARDGANIAEPAAAFDWFDGPTLLQALDGFDRVPPPEGRPLRLPIQDVYRFDDRRILVGRIESGRLAVGDRVLFSPSNKTGTVSRFEAWNEGREITEAEAGRSVGISLAEPLFVERGETLSHETQPPSLTNVFKASVFWLGRGPLTAGAALTLKIGTATYRVTVDEIQRVIDTDTLEHRSDTDIPRHGIGEIVLRSRALMAVDEGIGLPATGRFVLLDGADLVGGGLVSMEGYPDRRASKIQRPENLFSVDHAVSQERRWQRTGHSGGVIWLTGLSGAGKSTLAMALEALLFDRGYQTYVLDGDNVRFGLNANLGFSPEDRAENIRRVGEAAALFADSGTLCITAFISPYRSDRDRARAAVERLVPGGFHEVHVAADLAVCERRDPKGLYRRARLGEILDFTGIGAPYEAPTTPELSLDTGRLSLAESLDLLLDYTQKRFVRRDR